MRGSNTIGLLIMHTEIQKAANFFVYLMKCGHNPNVAKEIGETQFEKFTQAIVEALSERYRDHWYPENPSRGQGYRCVTIDRHMDRSIKKAAESCGINPNQVRKAFSLEFTMWIDPEEVSYQMGDNGSVCVLYENKQNNAGSNTTSAKKSSAQAAWKPDSRKVITTNSTSITDLDTESSTSGSVDMEDVDVGNQLDVISLSTSNSLKQSRKEPQKMNVNMSVASHPINNVASPETSSSQKQALKEQQRRSLNVSPTSQLPRNLKGGSER